MNPKVTDSRPLGNMALCKLRLGLSPKVGVSLLLRSVTPHSLWTNPWRKGTNLRWRQPAKVSVSRPRGTLTPGKHWWDLNPKVRHCRTLSSVAPRQRDPVQALVARTQALVQDLVGVVVEG